MIIQTSFDTVFLTLTKITRTKCGKIVLERLTLDSNCAHRTQQKIDIS